MFVATFGMQKTPGSFVKIPKLLHLNWKWLSTLWDCLQIMQTDPPHTGRRILLVKWRGWPFIGKNKQQGQQTSGGVTESDSWRGGGLDANPLWQLLCYKVWLCQAGMSFYTRTCTPHVQRPCCNTWQTRYNISYQPERCFTHHSQLKEGRAAKTGALRLLS